MQQHFRIVIRLNKALLYRIAVMFGESSVICQTKPSKLVAIQLIKFWSSDLLVRQTSFRENL